MRFSKNLSGTVRVFIYRFIAGLIPKSKNDIFIGVWPTQPFGPRPPLGGKKIFQKEQPVMDKKPSLSIHIELYIIYPFPNNKYWRTFFSFLHLRKVILPDFSLLGFKRKRIWIWKRNKILGRRKKCLFIRPCLENLSGNLSGLFESLTREEGNSIESLNLYL